MKKTIAIVSLVTLASVASVAVSAHDGIYVSGNVGGEKTSSYQNNIDGNKDKHEADSYKAGLEGGAALGYAKGPIRGEISISQLQNKLPTGKDGKDENHKVTPIMVNAYYDFTTQSPIKPFVGVGLGDVKLNKDDVKDSALEENNFGYQGIVGAKYVVNEHVDVSVDYRYLATTEKSDKDTANNDTKEALHANIAEAGVTYHF